VIPTGSIGIDIALGGGWHEGTMNEIWGDTGSGKTVLALHTVESMTRVGKHTVWIDTVDGVAHMDSAPRVIVCRPRHAEHAFFVAIRACDELSIGLIVFDSANMLVRENELNGDPTYVPHPQREYREELNYLKAAAQSSGTTVLFVSQPRDKERQPIRGTGISEKVKYRVHLHPDVIHQDGSREIQATVKDVPGKKVVHEAARFTIRPGEGIDQARELTDEAAKRNVIHKSGSWYHWPEGVSAHGAREMAAELRKRPHMMHEVDKQIRAFAGIA
jgi:recombination protein RecA